MLGVNSRSYDVFSLILINLVIAVFAILRDWSLYEMLSLFWIENLIIGAFNILKMAMGKMDLGVKQKDAQLPLGCLRIFLIPFFIIHYFIFCLVHGVFIYRLFGPEAMEGSVPIFKLIPLPETGIMDWAILGLIISHLISFIVNFIGKKEYKQTTVPQLMFGPYKRIVLIHVFIIACGFLMIQVGGKSFWFMILFFAGKLILDLLQHQWSHKRKVTEIGEEFTL